MSRVSFAFPILCAAIPGQLFVELTDRQISLRSPEWAVCADAADVDADGDVDLFLGYYGPNYWTIDRLLLNDGHGRLLDAPQRLPPLRTIGTARFADLDGDNDPDLLLCGSDVVHVLLNDGVGTFLDATPTHGVAGSYWRMAVLDCDGDGDVDAVVQPTRNRVGPTLLTNDGSGRLSVRTLRIGGLPTTAFCIEPSDVDGDGDLDLVVLQDGGQLALLLNDGRGNFADESWRIGPTLPGSYAARTADIDGDGDPDIIVGAVGSALQLLRNDGSGGFQRDVNGIPSEVQASIDLAFLDADGDGRPDLAVGNAGSRLLPHRLYLNRAGSLVVPAQPLFPITDTIPQQILPADFDGDGDADLVIAGGSYLRRLDETQVFTNLRRHVHTAPRPRIGQTLVLDAWHEAEYATVPTPMVAALGPDLLPQPVPLAGLGAFWLAPPAIATLPVSTTTVPQGHTSWTLAVPPAQWLVGRSLHFQALALPGHVPWHLTNAVTVTFVP